MNSKDLQSLSEAYNQVQLDEAEGSYGQTPESTKRWNKATTSRMDKPASEYEKRGDKKKEVAKYSRHNQRTMSLDHDASRGPGKKSSRGVGGRQGLKMTQKDRDDARGQAEYGHTGYDPDWHGGPSAPGGKPKGKKLERQKKTGVSAESFDAYETILTHLLDEGYASTPEAADKIILNMSESWFENIMELNRYEKETGKDYKTGKEVTKGGTMGGDDTHSKVMRHMHKVMGAGRMGAGGPIEPRGKKKEKGKKPPKAGEYGGPASPEQKVKKRRADAQRAQDMMHSARD